ncbi:hypothetical protein CSUI_009367 [Cystoisospora suis]|uniref:Transmembrane protein n=1 Tax=Cystoisospora suis TaxID=483139 RepID=A0A2C6KKC4_9APIC|nr:hypothetical protein CSUI_009367 [Cystoisospora suis]
MDAETDSDQGPPRGQHPPPGEEGPASSSSRHESPLGGTPWISLTPPLVSTVSEVSAIDAGAHGSATPEEDASRSTPQTRAPPKRSRIQARRHGSGAGRGRYRQSPLLSRVSAAAAVFLIFLAFYTQKCLKRGFPALSFPRPFTSEDRDIGAERLSHLDGREPPRRLAGEESSLSQTSSDDSSPDSAEEALCGAIERAAHISRAAASRTIAEESDEGSEAESEEESESSPPTRESATAKRQRIYEEPDALSFLLLSNEVAQQVSREDYTLSRFATPEEVTLWTEVLEAEEQAKLASLRSRRTAFETGEMRTPSETRALLAAAVEAQFTLMKMSRIFRDRAGHKRVNLREASSHIPTLALAGELSRSWKALGVTEPTLKILLPLIVITLGTNTRPERAAVFRLLKPRVTKGVDPPAQRALVAEAAVFASAIAEWDIIVDAKSWMASGNLKLRAEDSSGALGELIAPDLRVLLQTQRTQTAIPLEEVPSQVDEGFAHLLLTDEVAEGLGRFHCAGTRAATDRERALWLRVLEAEEMERMASLRASMKSFEAHATPTRSQASDLLRAALQGQITLMRMARIYPEPRAPTRVNLTSVAHHVLTMTLACELRRSWKLLGVSDSTLKAILRITAVGVHSKLTEIQRDLIVDARRRKGDLAPHEFLAAQGVGKDLLLKPSHY